MKYVICITRNAAKIISALLFISLTCYVNGQITSYAYYYRVSFKDKGDNNPVNYTPEDLLSKRALNRRQKAGIPVPDFRDIPVFNNYIEKVSSLGFKLHCTSRWMNTALFKTQSAIDLNNLKSLPFISDIKIVKSPGRKNMINNKLGFQIEQASTPYDRSLTMLNGNFLHSSGFTGIGILIAILDGGFTYADNGSSLSSLHNRNGIKATYDFVKKDKFVYSFSTHGCAVLSVLSGNIIGQIEGSSPGADFLLLRTEDADSEFPVEEDFWVAGAEFADSSGADIISSSLGYYNFDDQSMNYKYSDLDGNTAFVTRAADIAASKGILVVNSAGNERNNFWKKIIFPADGKYVLAAGAVDGNNLISYFSSAGPSYDRRIKPDNSALGVNIPVQATASTIGRSNGTSFSCPVLSGMAACLMQAVPGALNTDIMEALHYSGDRYNSPDSLYGYGTPDMFLALNRLQDIYVRKTDKESMAGPNPTSGNIEVVFSEPPEKLTVEILSMTGRLIFRKDFNGFAGRTLIITELQNKEQGIYYIRLIKETGISVHKIIKLRN